MRRVAVTGATRVRGSRHRRPSAESQRSRPCTRTTRALRRPARPLSSPRRSTSLACGTRCPGSARLHRRSPRGESWARRRRRATWFAASAATTSRRRRVPSGRSSSCSRSLAGETRTEAAGDLDRVEPPPRVADLSSALVALVTEAGCVPQGNPDRLPAVRAQGWFRYDLDGAQTLASGRYESVHGGFDVTLANEDPNRLVPLDTVRGLERDGRVGRVHESLYTTTGNGTPVVVATSSDRRSRVSCATRASRQSSFRALEGRARAAGQCWRRRSSGPGSRRST